MRHPMVTAHTGCEGTPENSLESIRAGLEAGADTVEIDVRATRDLVAVLMHDDYLERRGGQVAVERLTLSELRDVSDRPVVTLDEALASFADPGATLNLDLKDDACIEPTVRLVRRYGLSEQVIITGCNARRAMAVREAGPELPVLLNVDPAEAAAAAESYADFAARTCRSATEAGCCGINVPYPMCRPELVNYARGRYLPVSVWTVDQEAAMVDMADMGVDSITTYRPKTLVDLLARRAHRPASSV